jgi:predicted Zn-dependent protease
MKWEEATDYINRARAAASNDPAHGLKLVNLYAARQDWQTALATAAELAEKFPASFDVIDAKARIQISVGDTLGALSTYRRAYERTPDSFAVFSRYLAALSAAKKFDQKRLTLKAALDRNPRDASLKDDLIRTEAEIGGLNAGLDVARNFANNDPDNSTYDVVSAELYEKAGRSGDGVGLLEKAVAARPSNADLTIALSGLYLRTGAPEKAETVLQARLKTDANDYAVRSALASVYSKEQKYGAAIAEYSHLIEEQPADPAALNNLAWLYQRQGDMVKARELAEQAATISPGTADIIDTLGWILLNQGEPEKALFYLTSATLSDPRSPDLQYHLSAALYRLGRSGEARARLEPLLGSGISFADKANAEKLLEELKHS